MDTQTFISKYRQAFGETAELPLLFYYDNEPEWMPREKGKGLA